MEETRGGGGGRDSSEGEREEWGGRQAVVPSVRKKVQFPKFFKFKKFSSLRFSSISGKFLQPTRQRARDVERARAVNVRGHNSECARGGDHAGGGRLGAPRSECTTPVTGAAVRCFFECKRRFSAVSGIAGPSDGGVEALARSPVRQMALNCF